METFILLEQICGPDRALRLRTCCEIMYSFCDRIISVYSADLTQRLHERSAWLCSGGERLQHRSEMRIDVSTSPNLEAGDESRHQASEVFRDFLRRYA